MEINDSKNIQAYEFDDSEPDNVDHNVLSIFDIPIENPSLECNANKNSYSKSLTNITTEINDSKNIQVNVFDETESESLDQSLVNHTTEKKKSEEKITIEETNNCPNFQNKKYCKLKETNNQYLINEKIKKSDVIKYDSSENKNVFNIENPQEKKSIGQFDLKCQCNIFFTLNKNANKILNSKTQHFAFNSNAIEARTTFLHQKQWEANILKNLIAKDKKSIIQSKTDLSTLSCINKKRKENCINSEEIGNNDIEPNILNMLKDVYVDVEYLSDSCDYYDDDKTTEMQHIIKNANIIFQDPKEELMNMIYCAKKKKKSISPVKKQNDDMLLPIKNKNCVSNIETKLSSSCQFSNNTNLIKNNSNDMTIEYKKSKLNVKNDHKKFKDSSITFNSDNNTESSQVNMINTLKDTNIEIKSSIFIEINKKSKSPVKNRNEDMLLPIKNKNSVSNIEKNIEILNQILKNPSGGCQFKNNTNLIKNISDDDITKEYKMSKLNLKNDHKKFKDSSIPFNSDNNTESSQVNTINTLKDTNIEVKSSIFKEMNKKSKSPVKNQNDDMLLPIKNKNCVSNIEKNIELLNQILKKPSDVCQFKNNTNLIKNNSDDDYDITKEYKKSKLNVKNDHKKFKDSSIPLNSDNNTESSQVNTINTLKDTNIEIKSSIFKEINKKSKCPVKNRNEGMLLPIKNKNCVSNIEKNFEILNQILKKPSDGCQFKNNTNLIKNNSDDDITKEFKNSKFNVKIDHKKLKDSSLPLNSDNNTESSQVNMIHSLKDTNTEIEPSIFKEVNKNSKSPVKEHNDDKLLPVKTKINTYFVSNIEKPLSGCQLRNNTNLINNNSDDNFTKEYKKSNINVKNDHNQLKDVLLPFTSDNNTESSQVNMINSLKDTNIEIKPSIFTEENKESKSPIKNKIDDKFLLMKSKINTDFDSNIEKPLSVCQLSNNTNLIGNNSDDNFTKEFKKSKFNIKNSNNEFNDSSLPLNMDNNTELFQSNLSNTLKDTNVEIKPFNLTEEINKLKSPVINQNDYKKSKSPVKNLNDDKLLPIKSKINTDFGSNIENQPNGWQSSYNRHLIDGNNFIKEFWKPTPGCEKYKIRSDKLILRDKDHTNTEFSQTNTTHNLKDKSINVAPNIEFAPSSQFGNNTILIHEDNFTEDQKTDKKSKCKVKNNQNILKDSLLPPNIEKSLTTSHENVIPTLKDTYTISPPIIEIQPTNFDQSSNNMILMNGDKFTEDSISLSISELPKESLYNSSNNDNDKLFNYGIPDDDDDDDDDDEDKLQIDCEEDTEFCDKKLINTKNKQSIDMNKDEIVIKPNLLEEVLLSSNKQSHSIKEESFSEEFKVMSFEKCNNFYEKKSIGTNDKNEHFPKNINEIFKEMYVDEVFVSLCQHMVESCGDIQLKCNSVHSNTCSEKFSNIKIEKDDQLKCNSVQSPNYNKNVNVSEKIDSDIKTENEKNTNENNKIFKVEDNKNNIERNIPCKKIINTNHSNKRIKANMKIRTQFRDLINSNNPINEILESKEFRGLRYFPEEEIAGSIGVLIFEQTIGVPCITGLLAYRENNDQMNTEVKNKYLRSINLSINCPDVIKLTTITLALAKMLRSNTLVNFILTVIRKNVFQRKMSTDHSNLNQLIKQTAYFVDICFRLRLLKTLQTFIFDAMVLLPNKYCCIIFVSLLIWNDCLPICNNNKQDPVIIKALSYLIAKHKFYSEQRFGCDVFQRELINLLSCHFNYTFSTDLPNNFIENVQKPDFFISVVMILKCCNPKDLSEFIINCLFPIIEDYLNTQQNETNALKTLESIYLAIKPFQISCNGTVATFLHKYKSRLNGSNKEKYENYYINKLNSYSILQNKFIEYFHDGRSRSPLFEESLVSIIMVLGSVDYATSCMTLLKWKPKHQPSSLFLAKMSLFKSVIGTVLWNKLFVQSDTNTIKSLINSCLLSEKDVCNPIIKLHALQ